MQRSPLCAVALLAFSTVAVGQFPVWTQEFPAASPTNLLTLTFDAATQRTIGVDHDPNGRIRVWSWDGRVWSVVPAQGAPTATTSALALCGDSGRGVLVLVRWANGSPVETWELASGIWSLIATAGAPAITSDIDLHYSATRSSCLLCGRRQSTGIEVWEYSAARWQLRPAAQAPPNSNRNTLNIAYDTVRDRFLLFGGLEGYSDTWEWDGSTWMEMQPPNSPPSRQASAPLAYDPTRRRVVLYGGTSTNPFTWEWDGTNWLLNPTAPPAPTNGRMAHDVTRGRTVFFFSSFSVPPQTWEYFMPLQASYVPFGSGCLGSVGVVTLAAVGSSLPWLRSTLTCRLTNLPNSPVAVPFGLLGVSRQTWFGIPLPFDLAPFGAPGCNLLVSVEQAVQLANNGGTAEWQFSIPASVALLGATFFQQALVLDPAANAFGAVLTNAATATIGDR